MSRALLLVGRSRDGFLEGFKFCGLKMERWAHRGDRPAAYMAAESKEQS
jgi:hypothetical protein